MLEIQQYNVSNGFVESVSIEEEAKWEKICL